MCTLTKFSTNIFILVLVTHVHTTIVRCVLALNLVSGAGEDPEHAQVLHQEVTQNTSIVGKAV